MFVVISLSQLLVSVFLPLLAYVIYLYWHGTTLCFLLSASLSFLRIAYAKFHPLSSLPRRGIGRHFKQPVIS